jgi:hypothetical protein
MIKIKLKQITVAQFLLNSLLDDGLYLTDKNQLRFFVWKYLKHNQIFMKGNDNRKYEYTLDNKQDFLNFMLNKYGI